MDEGSEEERMSDIIDGQSERIDELEEKLKSADSLVDFLLADKGKLKEKDDEIAELNIQMVVKDSTIKDYIGLVIDRKRLYDEVWDKQLDLEAKLADKEGVFQGFIDRINIMALVYGRLQQSDSGKMSMWMCATNIVSPLRFEMKGIRVNIDIPMDLALPAKIAIPCGLIINELVSNSFKHAFPDGLSGEVKVEMRAENTLLGCQGRRLGVVAKGNRATPMKLVVSDNGVGLPGDFNLQKLKSLGMEIVRSLTDQLGADVDVCTGRGKGTKFIIKFEI